MQLQEGQQHQRQNGQNSKAADKALALLLPDKGTRPMEVYMCQEGDSDDQDSHENKHQDTEQRVRDSD